MFAQMKSKRHTFTPPCNYKTCSCYCHQPESPEYKAQKKANDWHDTKLAIKVMSFLIITIGGIIWLSSSFKPVVRHIQVNGQDCMVKTIIDGCTSTGACRSHDEAICLGK